MATPPARVAFCMSTGLIRPVASKKELAMKVAMVLAERDNTVFTIAVCCMALLGGAAPATKEGQ